MERDTIQIRSPIGVDSARRTALAGHPDHLEQMIFLVLFTSPGERVNRPDFGCGLLQMVFTPNGSRLHAVTDALIRTNLSKWLGNRIEVGDISVSTEDDRLAVFLEYTDLSNGEIRRAEFTR